MDIGRIKKIVDYSSNHKAEIVTDIQRFYALGGIDINSDFLNLLQIARRILFDKGYLVFELPFADDEIGAMCYKGDGIGYVVLNTSLPVINYNFALAHEIYHVLFQQDYHMTNIEFAAENYYEHDEEFAANLFAGMIVMPENGFIRMFNKYKAESQDSIRDVFRVEFYSQLELENRALRQELLLKNSELLMLGQYKQKNARLRELLGSPLRQDEQKMVTQVISTVNDPYSDQVVIDKGSVNGVYEGQPVISDKGVVGQVVAVAKLTSRVLLICDATHALPIQVLRNDIRVIAAGNGCTDDLQLEHLPANTDIRVGDVLVTSGLGGRFPEGYPVAVVSSVKLDTQRAYTVIQARPTAGLQRLRYLLLLWGADRNGANPMTPEEVHRVANERLMQMMPQVLPSPDAMGPKLPEPATGITQPTPQQPATGNAVTAPAAPTQPAANRSPQRATPPQSGAQPPARTPGGQ